jgi:predicted nucleic acid-binding Zn ribbon protein
VVIDVPERLLRHSHCIQCDAPMEVSSNFCSEECDRDHHARIKSRTNRTMLFFVVVVLPLLA